MSDIDNMTGDKFGEIRRAANLSVRELADLLRINPDNVRQMENGRRDVTGPVRLVMEMIHDGRLKPDDELTEDVGGPD